MEADLPAHVIGFMEALTAARVLVGSCDAILVWEWMTSLPREYKHIWRSDVKLSTILFLLLRYFTFVTLSFYTWFFFWNDTEERCKKMVIAIQLLPTVTLFLAQSLIALRVYAIYDGSKPVLALLGLMLCAQVVTQCWDASSMTAVPRVAPFLHYCLPALMHQYAVSWTLPMIFDTTVLLLVIYKLWHLWRSGGHSRLVQVIIRDQVGWYTIVAAVSAANLIVAYGVPAPQGSKGRGVVTGALTAVTSISTCRIILNIRETAGTEMTIILPRSTNGTRGLTFPSSAQDPQDVTNNSDMIAATKSPIMASFKLGNYLPRSASMPEAAV